LKHDLKGSFIDLELDLWRALREVVREVEPDAAEETLAWRA